MLNGNSGIDISQVDSTTYPKFDFYEGEPNSMNIIDRVETVLLKNTKVPGITPQKLAKLAKTTVRNVHRRVYDLRQRGNTIYTNTRVMEGKTVRFYRAA